MNRNRIVSLVLALTMVLSTAVFAIPELSLAVEAPLDASGIASPHQKSNLGNAVYRRC